MLSLVKLNAHRVAYHERQIAARTDDYYTREDGFGDWYGRGADALGLLAERVEPGDIERLTRAQHPRSGAQLRRPAASRIVRRRIVDPDTGAPGVYEQRLDPVGGYDLVFSAPKSISLAHALAAPDVQQEIIAAHRYAVREALAILDEHGCYTRRGHAGTSREQGRGIVAALFDHELSREVVHDDGTRTIDPQLHTHCLVGNLTQSGDDAWRALDGGILLSRFQRTLGSTYHAVLRHEISRRLGWDWHPPEHGLAELHGWPHDALRAMSQRRMQIEGRLSHVGHRGRGAAQIAAHATRQPKNEPATIDHERAAWRQRLNDHGLDDAQLRRLVSRRASAAAEAPSAAALREIADRLAGPRGLTETRAAFTFGDAITAHADALEHVASHHELVAHVQRFLARDDIIPLDAAYTTRSLLADHETILQLDDDGRDRDAAPCVQARLVERAIRTSSTPLNAEQRSAVRRLATTPDAVSLLQARAGTGKTLTLGIVARAYTAAGYDVIGACPTGAAADTLTGTGVRATTIDALRHDWQTRGAPIGTPTLLIVDEAGMAGTRHLADLLRTAQAMGAKTILAGDHAQLPGVPASGAFTDLVTRREPIRLTTPHRHHDPAEAAALQALRSDQLDPDAYLAHKVRRGELRIAQRHDRAIAHAVSWWRRAAADVGIEDTLIITRDNDLREQLNQRQRAILAADGRLTGPELHAADRAYQAGDRIICRHNNRRIGVSNGTRATVTDVDTAARAIRVRADDGRHLRLPASYLDHGHAEHAYTLTAHTSQGATTTCVLVLARPSELTPEWAYTALTRSRAPAQLVLLASDPAAPTAESSRSRAMQVAERRLAARTHERPVARTHTRNS